jgi:Tfp pilus assembly protein PilN
MHFICIKFFTFQCCSQDVHRATVNELSKTRIDFAKLTEEMALTIGHTNTKQKIHHLQQMKQQIQNLVEENQKLRDAASNVDHTEAATIAHGKKSFVV